MREHPDVPLIRFLTFGNGEVVVCNSPDSFRDVLQTKCYSFRKSDFFRRLTKEIVGHGLVTSKPSPGSSVAVPQSMTTVLPMAMR